MPTHPSWAGPKNSGTMRIDTCALAEHGYNTGARQNNTNTGQT